MRRLRKGVLFSLSAMLLLAAATASAQGNSNRPGSNPNSPIGQGGQPQVVDRDGKVVGTLSFLGTTLVNYALPDGRKVLLRWGRDALTGHMIGSPQLVQVAFRSNDCSGPAYVWTMGAGVGASDPMTVTLDFPDPAPPPPFVISDGGPLPMVPMVRRLYVSESGARPRLWINDFSSHWNPFDFLNGHCAPGKPAQWQGPEVGAYLFTDTGIDLWREFEYPFRAVE